jgi:hypothetical protein
VPEAAGCRLRLGLRGGGVQVLNFLKKRDVSDSDTPIAFLESLIQGGEAAGLFHDELIYLYLDGVNNLLEQRENKAPQARSWGPAVRAVLTACACARADCGRRARRQARVQARGGRHRARATGHSAQEAGGLS